MNKVSENIDVCVKIDTPCVKQITITLQGHKIQFISIFSAVIFLKLTIMLKNLFSQCDLKIHRSPDLKHLLFARKGVYCFQNKP